MYIVCMEEWKMNFIHILEQDEETTLDALGELGQEDSIEATHEEEAMEAWSTLQQDWALAEL